MLRPDFLLLRLGAEFLGPARLWPPQYTLGRLVRTQPPESGQPTSDCHRETDYGEPFVALKSFMMSPFSDEPCMEATLHSIWKARRIVAEEMAAPRTLSITLPVGAVRSRREFRQGSGRRVK